MGQGNGAASTKIGVEGVDEAAAHQHSPGVQVGRLPGREAHARRGAVGVGGLRGGGGVGEAGAWNGSETDWADNGSRTHRRGGSLPKPKSLVPENQSNTTPQEGPPPGRCLRTPPGGGGGPALTHPLGGSSGFEEAWGWRVVSTTCFCCFCFTTCFNGLRRVTVEPRQVGCRGCWAEHRSKGCTHPSFLDYDQQLLNHNAIVRRE